MSTSQPSYDELLRRCSEAEIALQAAENKYRLITENVSDMISVHDVNGIYQYVSSACKMLLGNEPEELVGTNPYDLFHPDDIPLVQQSHDAVLDGHPLFIEYRLRAPDGTYRWVETNNKFIFDEAQQQVTGIICITRDISKRKEITEQLRASEEKFRAIFENNSIPMVIIELDTTISMVNAAYCEASGYTEDEVIGMSWTKQIHPDDLERLLENNRRRRKNPQATFDKYELIFYTKGGELRHALFSAAMVENNQKMICSFTDITESKLAVEALRESENNYRLLFNSITDAVFVHEISDNGEPGPFLKVNAAACSRYGYSQHEWLHHKMCPQDIDAPDGLAAISAAMQKLQTEGNAIWEGAHRTKDGRIIPVEISNTLIDYHGNPAILSTVRDITERKQAEEEREKLHMQLAQAQKMESVGRLAGGVSHDFNNMLGVIMGYADLALVEIDHAHPLYDHLSEIRKASERSADLTRQLLAFARKQTVTPRVLNLNDSVDGMQKMLRRLIGENINLAWHPGADLWLVNIDPSQVDQLLANLCINARDAINGVGNITIETENIELDEGYCARHTLVVPGQYVRLKVKDDGVGMDAQTMENIFEPFFTTKAMGQGTGL